MKLSFSSSEDHKTWEGITAEKIPMKAAIEIETCLSNNFVIATGIKLPTKTESDKTARALDPEISWVQETKAHAPQQAVVISPLRSVITCKRFDEIEIKAIVTKQCAAVANIDNKHE